LAPAAEAGYEEMLRNWYRGWEFRRTLLSEAFGFEDYLAQNPPGTLAIALIGKNGKVTFNSPEQELKPKAGDVVISYGLKPEKAVATEEEPA
jgi:hypothetical protein